MKRLLMVLGMSALLAMPVTAMAGDQSIPPEANWTPTPPARQTVDPDRLVSLLVEKGMISPQEYTQSTTPQVSSRVQEGQARVWTWDEIDHDPVRSRD